MVMIVNNTVIYLKAAKKIYLKSFHHKKEKSQLCVVMDVN